MFSPTGQPIEYTARYACEVGQFLLKERMLIQLRKNTTGSSGSPIVTPQQSLATERRRHQLTASFDHDVSFESSYSQDYSPGMRRSTLGSHGTGASSVESIGQGIRRRDTYQYRYHSRGSLNHIRGPAPEFMNNQTTFYKFTDSEDKDELAEYQSQILVASSHVVPQPAVAVASIHCGQGFSGNPHSGTTTITDTHQDQDKLSNARQQTSILVFDLLVQRARKEKRAKQFLQTPRALEIQGLRRTNPHTNCDLIIKM